MFMFSLMDSDNKYDNKSSTDWAQSLLCFQIASYFLIEIVSPWSALRIEIHRCPLENCKWIDLIFYSLTLNPASVTVVTCQPFSLSLLPRPLSIFISHSGNFISYQNRILIYLHSMSCLPFLWVNIVFCSHLCNLVLTGPLTFCNLRLKLVISFST